MEKHKLYDGKVTLLYDDGPHTYTVEGKEDIMFPSNTTMTDILDKPALRYWYVSRAIAFIKEGIFPGVPYDEVQLEEIFKDARFGGTRARDHAASIGIKIHEWIERYVTLQLATGKRELIEMPVHDGIQSSIRKFLAWEESNNPQYIYTERRMVSLKHQFSGTLDLLYTNVHGDIILGDIKTGKSVYPEHYLQTAGYAIMMLEENPKEFAKAFTADTHGLFLREIIHIPLKGNLKVRIPDNSLEDDMDTFLSLRNLYRWKEGK